MADNNICAGLEIIPIEFDRPFYEMYLAQKRLQLRLNSINTDYSINAHLTAKKCIYWYFCASAELKELEDWLTPEHLSDFESSVKEMKMEAIDVLHFIFNIALELSFTEDQIEHLLKDVPETSHAFDIIEIKQACKKLLDTVTELIELLPWKTWKAYPNIATSELPLVIEQDIQKAIWYNFKLCYNLGMSRQDVINYYFAKNKENHRRQDDGY